MAYENILYEKRDGIAYITINRPDVMNALNQETVAEIKSVFLEAKTDDEVRGAILTGAGEKAFVAGADISEIAKLGEPGGVKFAKAGHAAFNAIESLGKPVIAAVNGFALGGGCELAMACTVRIASSNAKFGQPEVNLGVIPGFAGTQRLPRLVGRGVALELILSGNLIDAQEAHRIGLVNRVVEPGEAVAEAEGLMKVFLSKGPIAVRLAMEAVYRGMDMPFAEGCNLEANLFGRACASEDMKEGTGAFLDKRKAEFKNK